MDTSRDSAFSIFSPSSPGKTGWPWTSEGPAFDFHQPWPRLTIITPSFNQAQFIEESIRSVLLQGYPNLEYIILDGGSTDGSVDVIRKYAPWITYWHSRPDKGHVSAINEGFRMATGEIVAWLNTDDIYLPGAFSSAILAFQDSSVRLIHGKAYFTDEENRITGEYPAWPLPQGWGKYRYWFAWPIAQPTTFFRRDVLEEFGLLDETYRLAMDYEWFIRCSGHIPFKFIDEFLAYYRIHMQSKSGDWEKIRPAFHRECLRANRYYASPTRPQNWLLWVEWFFYHYVKRPAKWLLRPILKR